ncbi:MULTISPECIES: amino acid ABC transporter permease [Priestia]|uniref:amino acid ABC transporter permease n=1 Tax=Priestia TaxID=2800373 RepID=UPI00232B1C32|nr:MULTISPECIES: amino acid ABC transporter permease [Priestia]MDC0702197.1 amino acid ABC transporter permease [Priestia sp. AB]MED3943500.1 amino acid ABC transporter permease [Priestia megaterium]MED4213300.1 amino acid ABC transporter permease [Priestia megaterium]
MPIIDLRFALEQTPEVLKGVPLTLTISIISMALGSIFGLFIAVCRIYKIPLLKQIAVIYVSFMRGTPLLVQLYVFFYGIPIFIEFLNQTQGWHLGGDTISPLIYALIAYTLNTSAYQSEVFRSSIQTIDRGQFEAAYSIGMTTFQAIKRIIFPQSLVAAIPNLGNIFISLIKATSLAFAVKVVEIMAISKVIANDGYRYLEMYLVASLIYWILCFFFERLFVVIEKKLSHYELREEVRSAS